MTDDSQHVRTTHSPEVTVSEIKTTINCPEGDAAGVYGIRTMVNDQKSELVAVKDDIQRIRDALTSHVAKEHVIY
jgi:hypothetical protein